MELNQIYEFVFAYFCSLFTRIKKVYKVHTVMRRVSQKLY